MLSTYGAGEDTWESLGQQGDQTSQSQRNQSWIVIGRTDAEAEAPILWPPDSKSWLTGKDPDAGKDWRQEEKWGDRGWDGWMASLTQWIWVWAGSRRWRRTGKPGIHWVAKSWTQLSNWTTTREKQLWFPRPGSLSLICTVTPMQTPVYVGSPTNTYTICLNIPSFLASF